VATERQQHWQARPQSGNPDPPGLGRCFEASPSSHREFPSSSLASVFREEAAGRQDSPGTAEPARRRHLDWDRCFVASPERSRLTFYSGGLV
jgi:hypothetical protein